MLKQAYKMVSKNVAAAKFQINKSKVTRLQRECSL